MKLNLHLRLSLIVALFVSAVTVIASYSFYNFTYNREQTRSLQAITQLSATVYKTAVPLMQVIRSLQKTSSMAYYAIN